MHLKSKLNDLKSEEENLFPCSCFTKLFCLVVFACVQSYIIYYLLFTHVFMCAICTLYVYVWLNAYVYYLYNM